MRKYWHIGPVDVALVVCALALVVMVYSGGWSWPLRAAAVMIPLSLLVG